MNATTKTGYRWALADATAAAQDLIKHLADYCERLETAGSIRRGKNSVKDIELVAVPKVRTVEIPAVAGQLDMFGAVVGGKPATMRIDSLLDEKLHELDVLKLIFKERPHTFERGQWGERYKKFWIKWGLNGKAGYIPVDLFIIRPPAQWGAIFTIRTGPSDFSQALMGYINTMTEFKQIDGRLVRKDDELVEVQTPEERDYFKALGLRWLPPDKRTAETMRDQVRFNRSQEARRLDEQRKARAEHAGKSATVADLVEPGEQISAPIPDNPTIKAITLHQPWASLIAAGYKEYETRSWPTSYRGLIAIHAGKTEPTMVYSDFPFADPDDPDLNLPDPPPLGCIVAIARLVNCIPTTTLLEAEGINALENHLGNFAPGRFAWKMEVIKVFDEPIPERGQQGLWDWDRWDGVIDENPPGKSATVADLQSGGEQVSASVQPPDPTSDALTVRIRRELERLPGSHPTVLIPRLGCDVAGFRSALWALKHFGEVVENHYGGLELVKNE